MMRIERQRRYRTFLIVLAYLIISMMGIRLGIYSELGSAEILYSIALALVLTHICIVDSRIVGKPLPPNSYWLIVMFSPFMVPLCIIRGRGMIGIGIVAAHFAGIMLVLIISCLVASLFVPDTMFSF